MLNVVMLSVVMENVMAPSEQCLKLLLSKYKYFDLINRSKLRISNLQQMGNFKLITFTVVKVLIKSSHDNSEFQTFKGL